MARYLYADVRTFLVAQGCYTEGDAYEIGVGWFTADGLPFTIPSPIDDHLDADSGADPSGPLGVPGTRSADAALRRVSGRNPAIVIG